MVPRKKAPETRLTAYKSNRIIYIGDAQRVDKWDDLNSNQLKIAMYSAAQVRPDDTALDEYSMTFKEFAELTGLDKDSAGGANYKRIFAEARKLMDLGVDFVATDGTLVAFKWLVSVKVSPKSGTVTYSIDKNLLPFYKTRAGSFALIELADYMRLRGKYSLLLYEFLAKWRSAGQVYQAIPALRAQLQVPDKLYPRTVNFLQRVLKGAVDEINEKTVVSFKVKIIEKRGSRKAVEGIMFIIKPIVAVADDRPELLTLLQETGVDAPAAEAIVNTYSAARIKGNLDYVEHYPAEKGNYIKSMPALVCAAIKNDYAAVEEPSLFAFAYPEDDESPSGESGEVCQLCGGTKIAFDAEGLAKTCSCVAPVKKETDEDREVWSGPIIDEIAGGLVAALKARQGAKKQ